MDKLIHEALIELGFKKDGKYYRKNGDSIKVYSDTTLKEVFTKLMQFATTQKIWEIKKVLEITDSY